MKPTSALPRSFSIVCIASALFAMLVAFTAVGFAFPQSVGILINPHSSIGSIGMTIIVGICFILFGVQLVYIWKSVAAIIRNSAIRLPKAIAILGMGLAVEAALGLVVIPVIFVTIDKMG
jgi:hypothetical protein